MCGGDLSVTEGMKVVECDFCGTTQTVPSADNEKKTNLFNRANKLRIAGEFDRASGIYESIIAEFPSEAEAYWGLCLSKYGIEYVDDPRTAEKIPTCHRTSFESIFNDNNYKSALSCADVVARQVYESEARAIDSLQKGILEIVQKEKPFDVFICYKETDEFGSRTQDSVIAQDLYDRLTDKGFKTFFARITLEDKLGRAYEPYIFAALHSAKVMLAIGTKPEYFEAVWVKNEWSRYLDLMNSDKTKLLIPCYRDMDPYDMPDEFRNLQAQDMNKIGFTQDLLRGIGKVIEKEIPASAPAINAVPSANPAAESFVKRGFLFLEDGEWEKADEYFEKALDLDPECAEGYLGKLMVELRVKMRSELSDYTESYFDRNNYRKAVRFANAELASYLENLKNIAEERLAEKEKAVLESKYLEAKQWLERVKTTEDCERVEARLKQLGGYKDSAELENRCYELRTELQLRENENYYDGALKNVEKAKLHEAEGKYLIAGAEYKSAKEFFFRSNGFKDSREKARWCQEKIKEIELVEKNLEEKNQATILFEVADSLNPLALANGSHYAFEVQEIGGDAFAKAEFKLAKGISSKKVKVRPGNYRIHLKVYGWDDNPYTASPIHTADCSVRPGAGETWKISSKRPGVFSSIKLNVEKTF